jgi:hypothetical protein
MKDVRDTDSTGQDERKFGHFVFEMGSDETLTKKKMTTNLKECLSGNHTSLKWQRAVQEEIATSSGCNNEGEICDRDQLLESRLVNAQCNNFDENDKFALTQKVGAQANVYL